MRKTGDVDCHTHYQGDHEVIRVVAKNEVRQTNDPGNHCKNERVPDAKCGQRRQGRNGRGHDQDQPTIEEPAKDPVDLLDNQGKFIAVRLRSVMANPSFEPFGTHEKLERDDKGQHSPEERLDRGHRGVKQPSRDCTHHGPDRPRHLIDRWRNRDFMSEEREVRVLVDDVARPRHDPRQSR